MSDEQAEKRFKVGEAVVLVDRGYSGIEERVYATRVTKVGRRWVTIDDCRYRYDKFDVVTGMGKNRDRVGGIRILRCEDWDAEQAEHEARRRLYDIGVSLAWRRAPKALTNKAVWEALRGLVEQS